MTVYLKRSKNNISAVGEYDPVTKGLTVLKGSTVSADIAYTGMFRGAKTIEKHRAAVVRNCVVTENITFKSSSTAANFVTGSSTNGLVAWKDKDGRTLKEIISEVGE